MSTQVSGSASGLVSATLIAALVGGAAIVICAPAIADEVEWTIAPYIWASDVNLDVAVNGDQVIGANVTFNDLVDRIETAFLGYVEARGQRFGGFLDVNYVDLGHESTRYVGPGGPLSGEIIVETDQKMEFYELGGIYRLGFSESDTTRFELLFGARRLQFDQGLGITLPGASTTTRENNIAETDVIVGGRVIGQLSERWRYTARADYGDGGSDGTLNLLAAFGYRFGQTGLFRVDFGYRYMTVAFDRSHGDGVTTETDFTLAGPLVGFVFNF